jgi:large subunit ribosomal protein L10
LAISKKRKEELVAQYKDLIDNSRAMFVTEYTGLTVKQLEALRSEVRKVDGAFHITKNTLLTLALEEAGKPAPEEMFQGQVATGFALGEVPALAKALADFAKAEDNLVLRGGILDVNVLSAEQVDALAKLPSLDQLRSQIIGLIGTPAQNIAQVIAGGVRQVVNVIDAYAKLDESAEAEAA